MFDSFFNALVGLSLELRKHKTVRAIILWLTPIVAAVAAIVQLLIVHDLGYPPTVREIADPVSTAGLIISATGFFMALLSFSSYAPALIARRRLDDDDLDALRREREQLRAKLTQETQAPQRPADILDTIRLNLNQLTEYYTINKSQARGSFRASIGAMIVGLGTILAGVWILYSRPGGDLKVPVIAASGGVLAEFIAGAYFYLYNRSLSQLNYFFDKLTSMQDTMLAVKLCDSLPEPNSVAAKEQLIELLMTNKHGMTGPGPAQRGRARPVEARRKNRQGRPRSRAGNVHEDLIG